jgi:hypothetical protein
MPSANPIIVEPLHNDPIEIVTGALEQHTKMIKQMKGVPGNSAVFDFLRSTMGYSWDFGYSVQLM